MRSRPRWVDKGGRAGPIRRASRIVTRDGLAVRSKYRVKGYQLTGNFFNSRSRDLDARRSNDMKRLPLS